jgi:hypothetical protein
MDVEENHAPCLDIKLSHVQFAPPDLVIETTAIFIREETFPIDESPSGDQGPQGIKKRKVVALGHHVMMFIELHRLEIASQTFIDPWRGIVEIAADDLMGTFVEQCGVGSPFTPLIAGNNAIVVGGEVGPGLSNHIFFAPHIPEIFPQGIETAPDGILLF